MSYLFNFPNATGVSGPDSVVTQTIQSVSILTPLALLFVFMVIWLGGTSRQKAKYGTSDYAMWGTVAGLGTFMVGLLMAAVTGYISLEWLIITAVVTLGFGLWLFLDQKITEV